MLMKTEKEKVTRNFIVISATLCCCCCCHAILSSSVLCLFFFSEGDDSFHLEVFLVLSCVCVCVMDGFFFSFPSPVDPPFPVGGFFFSGKIAVSLRVVQLPPRKKKSRVSPPCPLLCSSYIHYLIHFLVTRGTTKQKNNLHLISNSCSYTGLFPSSYSLCDCWLENFQRENMEGRKEE